jgi:hypothetical protein
MVLQRDGACRGGVVLYVNGPSVSNWRIVVLPCLCGDRIWRILVACSWIKRAPSIVFWQTSASGVTVWPGRDLKRYGPCNPTARYSLDWAPVDSRPV